MFSISFAYLRSFFICPTDFISPPAFVLLFLFRFLLIYHWLPLFLHKLDRSSQWYWTFCNSLFSFSAFVFFVLIDSNINSSFSLNMVFHSSIQCFLPFMLEWNLQWLSWFGLGLWYINYCLSFSVKLFLYIYIKYMINIFKWVCAHFFTHLNGFTYFYLLQIHSWM